MLVGAILRELAFCAGRQGCYILKLKYVGRVELKQGRSNSVGEISPAA
jgi:hypothetical protein